MDRFKLYTAEAIYELTNKRAGEQKLGEQVQVINALDELYKSNATFVLLGIPEDIGVRANQGIGGAKTAWEPTLKTLLNFQSNTFLNGNEILVLGYFEIEEPLDQSLNGLRKKTKEIDDLVAPIIEMIIKADKIPIIIGGGHNNALPIIMGAAKGLRQKINVINIDAHADLRNTAEGRHSGNGFSTALEKEVLNQYYVYGVHQSYLNDQLVGTFKNQPKLSVAYLDNLLKDDLSIVDGFKEFIKDLAEPSGLEIDLDSIEGVLSSAASPTGLPLNDIRKIILNSSHTYCYLHICEGAFELTDGKKQETIGKVIAYLITDFVKALLPRIYPQP
jgi:formiminoglutamase